LPRRPTFRLVGWCAAIGWLTWAASVGLLLGQHWFGVLHRVVIPFLLLLVATLLASLTGTAGGMWRVVRGPRRRAATAWGLACFVPLGFWTGLSVYTLRLKATGQSFPKHVFSDIASTASATVMEGQVRLAYPHRQESQRLVMFYDDRVTDPHKDLEAMDRHVADLEAVTGQPLRAKIHWVRGEVFGVGKMAIRGLCLGSSRSPADEETADDPDRMSLDRHELAHGVVHQLQPPEADPPTLLIEGWAVAYSGVTPRKLAEWAIHSRALWRERTGAGDTVSRLRELTGAAWYHRLDGPVYNVGGALAHFVVREYGAERFLRWYFECRPGRVEVECLTHLGVEFDALDSAFWAEAERLAGEAAAAKD
jgi:hypothetical protein